MKKKIKRIKKIIKYIILIGVFIGLGFIYLNVEYPVGYTPIIKEYAKKYDLDPYLIASIINVESSYDKEALSPKSAKGLMQISPQTGQWASEELNIENYREERLFEPEISIMIGTWYLDRLRNQFDNDLDHILIAYNAGSGNLNKWLENEDYCQDGKNIVNIPFKETEDYLVKVKHNQKIYSTLYKGSFQNTEEDSFYLDLVNNMKSIIKQIVK